MKLISITVKKKYIVGYTMAMLFMLTQHLADIYSAITTGYLFGLGTVVDLNAKTGFMEFCLIFYKLMSVVIPIYFITLGCNVVDNNKIEK